MSSIFCHYLSLDCFCLLEYFSLITCWILVASISWYFVKLSLSLRIYHLPVLLRCFLPWLEPFCIIVDTYLPFHWPQSSVKPMNHLEEFWWAVSIHCPSWNDSKFFKCSEAFIASYLSPPSFDIGHHTALLSLCLSVF